MKHILSFIYSNKKEWLARRINFKVMNKRMISKFYKNNNSPFLSILTFTSTTLFLSSLLQLQKRNLPPLLFYYRHYFIFFAIIFIFFETLECHISRNSHRNVKMCKFIASSMAKKRVIASKKRRWNGFLGVKCSSYWHCYL